MYITEKLLDVSMAPSNPQGSFKTKGCLAREITSRLLSAAQLLVSIVALPILLLIGLLETTFHLCTCSSNTLNTLKITLLSLDLHLCIFIPVSFAGIFLPYSATGKIDEALAKCQKPIINFLEPTENNTNSTTEDSQWNQGQYEQYDDQPYTEEDQPYYTDRSEDSPVYG